MMNTFRIYTELSDELHNELREEEKDRSVQGLTLPSLPPFFHWERSCTIRSGNRKKTGLCKVSPLYTHFPVEGGGAGLDLPLT